MIGLGTVVMPADRSYLCLTWLDDGRVVLLRGHVVVAVGVDDSLLKAAQLLLRGFREDLVAVGERILRGLWERKGPYQPGDCAEPTLTVDGVVRRLTWDQAKKDMLDAITAARETP